MKLAEKQRHRSGVVLKEGKNVCPSGTLWIKSGVLHRDDGPAIEDWDGRYEWFRHGLLHRDDGPALISSDGRKEWWQFGAKHRDGEPAVIYPDGKMQWYQKGLMHRDDGPASEHPNGHKEWWLNGNELSQEEFAQWRMKKDLNEKLHTTLPSRSIARRGKI